MLNAFHHFLNAIPRVPALVILDLGLKQTVPTTLRLVSNAPVVRFGLRGLSFPVIAPSNLFGVFTKALERLQFGLLCVSTASKNNISWNQREDGNVIVTNQSAAVGGVDHFETRHIASETWFSL
jgi:hypothetical protein